MKSMIKIMTLAVLLTLLMPGIYGDAYGIYDADSNELSAYIFEMPVNPEIFAINDLYNYSNYYTPYLASFQNTVRTQYILEFTANDIDYEFETMVQTEGYEDVPAYIATEELTPDRINGYISTAQLYPGVEILGYPTEDYNCHSYAWYMRSIANPYWIIDIDIYAYDVHTVWRENTETLRPGDICVYLRNGVKVHSAVVVSSDGDTIICQSKWGPSVLCEHPIGSVPSGYLDIDGQLRCYVMTTTPHEWSFETTGVNQHTSTCSICNHEETQSCEYEYTYFYDDMHNASCKYCDNGFSGAFCTFEYTSNGNGTHTGTCVCGNTQTYNCYMKYTNVSNTTHSGSCVMCGYSVSAQKCTLVYEQNGGQNHTVSCTKCENRRTQTCSHIYVSHGDNTHSYLCSLCGYVKIDHAACFFNANNICRVCGAPKNGAVINKLEEVTPE